MFDILAPGTRVIHSEMANKIWRIEQANHDPRYGATLYDIIEIPNLESDPVLAMKGVDKELLQRAAPTLEEFSAKHAPVNWQKGQKFDLDKPRMDLLDTYALEQTAKVLTFGAKKYAAHNWREGIAYSRLIAAAYRHLGAFNAGEDNDPETGLSHIAHLSCCVMFLLGLSNSAPENDDRYKPSSKEKTNG